MATVNLAPFSYVLYNKFPHLFIRLMLTLHVITILIFKNQLYQMSWDGTHKKLSEEKLNSLCYLYLFIASVISAKEF